MVRVFIQNEDKIVIDGKSDMVIGVTMSEKKDRMELGIFGQGPDIPAPQLEEVKFRLESKTGETIIINKTEYLSFLIGMNMRLDEEIKRMSKEDIDEIMDEIEAMITKAAGGRRR